MTLLRDIQAAATDPKVSVSTLLLKAKILAARLKDPEFESWVNHELNGYEDEQVPTYRILTVTAKASMTDGFRHFPELLVLTSFLPDKFKHWGEKCFVRQSVSELEQMKGAESLMVPWPQEIAVEFGAEGYGGGPGRSGKFQCIKAWQDVNPAALAGILGNVTSRLLDFSLKLEVENPEAGEAAPNTQPIAMERLQPLVQNIFYGQVGNIAQGSQGFQMSATLGASVEDLTKFAKEMREHIGELNLATQDQSRALVQIAAIEAELQGEADSSLVNQSVRTLRNITEGALGSLLATAATRPAVWHWVQQFFLSFGKT